MKFRKVFLFSFLVTISCSALAQDECLVNGFSVETKKTATSAYESYLTRTICQLPEFYENSPKTATNIYGSRTDKRTTATGYYYVKQIDGRWWVVDPDGYLSICRAINAVATGSGTTSKNTFASKYSGSTTVWMNKTKELLKENGFYCAGAWSSTSDVKNNPSQSTQPLAYTIILNWMSGYGDDRTTVEPGHAGYPYNCIFVFEPGFAQYCETKAQALAANKTDKNIFGYFSDNELPFYNSTLDNFLRKGKVYPNDDGYKAALKWLSDNGYTPADTTNTEVQKKFLGYVAETYYSIVYNAIKKYDPNHMVIGSRVNVAEARENQYFMQAAGKYVDIQSVNYYGVWTPSATSMQNWGKNLNKPFMVTEFYTKGDDVGLANTSGAGWIVHTQKDRGFAYQNYTLALLESKYCVGWHWFKYMDNDPSIPNAEPSNTDANKGIVNIAYEPYTDMMGSMKSINLNVYKLIDYFDRAKQTTTIYPEADAYFKGSENHGTDDRLGVKYTTDINYFRQAFLRFDLAGVSNTAVKAELRLFVLNAGDAGKTYKADYVQDDNWTESSITYASHPSATTELGRWKHGSDLTLDVSASVFETAAADKKWSMMLSAVDASSAQLEYASRENTTTALRPRIDLTEGCAASLAYLSDIYMDGKRFQAFNPDTLVYTVSLPQQATVAPTLTVGKPNRNINAVVTNASNVLSSVAADRAAKLIVTSADGSQQKTYTINFKVGSSASAVHSTVATRCLLFPNPVKQNETLQIKTDCALSDRFSVKVTDLSGKLVAQSVLNAQDNHLCIKGVQKGLYLVSISDSGRCFTAKLTVI